MMRDNLPTQAGFSIVEVIVAIVILTFGVLAMAAATTYITVEIRVADMRTERVASVQIAIEQLRSLAFDSLASRDVSLAETYGSYDVWWDITDVNENLKDILIITRGRGYVPGTGYVTEQLDTFSTSLARISP